MVWQLLLTPLIVAACALYALWSLLPAGWRRRWRARLGGTAASAPSATAGACGGCASCGDALPPPQQVIRFVSPPGRRALGRESVPADDFGAPRPPRPARPAPPAPAATGPRATPTTRKA